ncbi:hypothetical protein HF888_11915 [Bermanella marisrubri]|uniref:Flagellar hook-length control protein n=1 Tax=Bermanella marisrubri TaxID=207949 RepID=Q1N2V8_9GAMM|nr:flagellar hook-length control protein FliK [Bermanella marisrubri]EAT12561.1 Flagellar hook-length control protein [Oceanobacter sp. RED65] [Bermanella marisrubri]QIZ84882.1 hypothetical protein HF888_11915 [Bermanella marisrubri]
MQGLPFFSFSSQSAGPLADGQASTNMSSGPVNMGPVPETGTEQATSQLPEFMQRLLQAMTQDAQAETVPKGQVLAAEEETAPLLELQEDENIVQTLGVSPLSPVTKMDMDSIQVQRDFAPSVNQLSEAQRQAIPGLMARAQINQTAPESEASSSLVGSSIAEQKQTSMQAQPKLQTSPFLQTDGNVDLAQSTVEVQSKLSPQSSPILENTIKNMRSDEKRPMDSIKGGEDTSKLTALMTPIAETKPLAERVVTTEQIASMSASSVNEMTSEVSDVIDEMWQQTQNPARHASTKPAAGAAPSFFEQIQAKLDLPPSDIRFSEQVSKRIGMMVTEQMQSARIQLDPPELGSLEIKVRVQQDQVNVSFASNNHAVRDALEAQAPRLREMLNQQGVDLGNLDVSSQGQQSSGGDGHTQDEGEYLIEDEGTASSEALDQLEQQIKTIENDGAVDYFA